MGTSVHADTTNTLRISGRRFERSPFFDCHSDADMVFGVYAGRFYTVANGVPAEESYWALRRKAIISDVPERPVEISGPDAVAFLERVFARRIATLKEGRGRYAIACTHKGGLFMDGVLFRLEENRFWYVQPDGALETWLLAHSAGFDVTISDPHARVLQIQGPASPAIIRDASGGAVGDKLGYFHAGYFDIGGQQVYVWTAELGYELYVEWDKTDCRALWDHLMAAGEPHGMINASVDVFECRRLEGGILDNITDFDITMNPWEAGLGAFVDLDKEADFIGRDALRAISEHRTRLLGITCAETTPDSGDTVMDGDKAVGRITAGAWSPFQKCGIGYVQFAEAGDWKGRDLTLAGQDGKTTPCTVVPLPFYDPEKRIPRGLDRDIP
jgi:glycine cleavage system aminomethyltransferase T